MGAPQRQSAEFYVHGEGTETLWDGGERYYVIRNGEMRIHFGEDILRYTEDLLKAGVCSDRVLSALNISSALAETHDLFQIIDSPWFEVVDSSDPTDMGEVYHYLDEAVERAQALDLRMSETTGIL